MLKPNGHIVISIQNIGHSSIKAQLLDNNFIYTKTGLLDNTHIKFFTKNSIPNFLSKINLQIDACDASTARFNGDYPPDLYKNLSIYTLVSIYKDKFSHIYQFILKCSNSKDKYETLLQNNTEKINNITINKRLNILNFIKLISTKYKILNIFLNKLHKSFYHMYKKKSQNCSDE